MSSALSVQVRIRRGTASAISTFTGAAGEIIYNLTTKTIHTNDGVTVGGTPLAKTSDLSNFLTSATQSEYATSAWVTNNFLSAGTVFLSAATPIPSITGLITESSADAKYQIIGNYLTSATQSQFATSAWAESAFLSAGTPIPSTSGLLSQSSADAAYVAIGSLSAVSQFTNDAGYLTSAPAYATSAYASATYQLRGNYLTSATQSQYVTSAYSDARYVQIGSLSSLSQFINTPGYVSAGQLTAYATSAWASASFVTSAYANSTFLRINNITGVNIDVRTSSQSIIVSARAPVAYATSAWTSGAFVTSAYASATYVQRGTYLLSYSAAIPSSAQTQTIIVLDEYIPEETQFIRMVARCSSGSGSYSVTKNGTAITGLLNIAITTIQVITSATANLSAVFGDRIALVVSAGTDMINTSFSLHGRRNK